MEITEENKGYTLAVMNRKNRSAVEKIFLKPMALYIPEIASEAVSALLECLEQSDDCTICNTGYALTMTNNNNGISVDKDFMTLATLADPNVSAEAVKELINIVRGYDNEDEHNVCGW